MQNTDTAALALDLEFFQSGLGFALLLVAALLALVCVLLTVLVVSSSTNHRILLAHLESANKLLVHINETLSSNQQSAPVRRPVMLNEPKFPPPPAPEREAPRPVTPVEPPRPAVQNVRANPDAQTTERRQAGNPSAKPVRNPPADRRTDVFVSTDAAQQNVLPPRGGRKDTRTGAYQRPEGDQRAQPKRGGRAGDSTDIFTSIDS